MRMKIWKEISRCTKIISIVVMVAIIFSGVATAYPSVPNYAPVQNAVKQAIEDGNFSIDDIEGNPEYDVKILEKNETHIKLLSTTKITFKNPRGAGFGNSIVASSSPSFDQDTWPKFQLPNGDVTAEGDSVIVDYDQEIKNYILAEINNISNVTEREQKLKEWNNNGYEYGSRTFEFKEIFEATYSNNTLVQHAEILLGTESQTDSSNILMGFTQPIYWQYTREDNLYIVGIWVAWTKLDAITDAAFGLRLPISASVQMPNPMIRGGSYNIKTHINGEDWNASQYNAANVNSENGNEFVARAKFTLTLQADIATIGNIGPLNLDKGVDYGDNFRTPIGPDEQFSLPVLILNPDQTNLRIFYGNYLAYLWMGIGLMIEPKLGSDRISANWIATGDSTGNGLVEYHLPNTDYNFGPIMTDNYDPTTDYANIKLSNYNYYLTVCKLDLSANVQGGLSTIIGSLAIGTPYVHIYSHDCGAITGGLILGTHSGTNANNLIGNGIVTKSLTPKVTINTDKKTYSQGEIVQFTMYNYNSYPIEIDFKPSVLDNTGECIWGCIYAMIYDPITIPPRESYSWTWDQTGENGQVNPGYYKGELGGYYSNKFKINGNNQDSTITVMGHIESGVEAGCTILITDSGGSYELMYAGSLPPIGSYVIVTGTIMNNMVSICMQGPILKVQRIFVIG